MPYAQTIRNRGARFDGPTDLPPALRFLTVDGDGQIDYAIGGVNGQDGAPGSVWREGTGAPANGLGIDGDFYLNDANGDVYQKAAGTYSVVANIKGATGATGAAGADGEDGAPGADGQDGADGATGPTGPAPSGTGLVSVTGGTLDVPATLRARVAADAANLRSDLALGDAATKNVGTAAGTVAAGDHNHTGVFQPLDTQLTALAGLDYAGNAAKVIAVTAGADGFELVEQAGGGEGIPLETITQAGGLVLGTGAGAVTELSAPSTPGHALVYDGSTNKLGYGFPTDVSHAYLWPSTGNLRATYNRAAQNCTAISALTSGRLFLVGIALPKGLVVTGIAFWSGTMALSGGSNQWFALFDSSGAKLAITGDDTNTAWGSLAKKALNLTSPYTTTAGGLYYLGVCVVASTVPQLLGATGLATTAARGASPISAGLSTASLTNPASCPNPAAAPAANASFPFAEVY